jgi:hypothetical protein
MTKLWTPRPVETEALPEPKCPASKIDRYSDTGRAVAYCGVERRHFPVQQAPQAVLMFCCGEYGECPVWQAERDHDPVIERVHKAQDAAKAREIDKNLRVPSPDEAHRELIQELEDEKAKQRLRKLNEED